jgi:alginate O-acetyltransferase complex protein AlgI
VAKRRFNPEMFYEGLISFVIGLSKKVLLADTLAVIVNKGFDDYLLLDTFSTVIVMAAYFLELYFDFSGYSDMAIGMGLMFGIKLPVNFNSPYKSASLKELWTRWHMTLTRSMTTYVYIPLGGSRKGKARTYLNVFIVFVLSGLWHGAAWTYVVWGVFTGIIVIWDNLGLIKPGRRLGVLMTDITFTLLLIPFRSPDLGVAAAMFRNLIKGWTGNVLRLATDTMNMPELYVPLQITERLLPGKEPVINVILMLVLIGIGMIVIAGKNAQYIRQNLASKKYMPLVLALLFIYSVISFSRVSTFIYFNF